jgi:hypothetical protein
MGTYLYTARLNKKEIYNILVDSSIEQVYQLKYACKPSWSWGVCDRYTKGIISRCNAVWAGKDRPKFLHTDFYKDDITGEDSASVYKNLHNIVCWYDSDEKCLEYIGKIVRTKVGKKYSITFKSKESLSLENNAQVF